MSTRDQMWNEIKKHTQKRSWAGSDNLMTIKCTCNHRFSAEFPFFATHAINKFTWNIPFRWHESVRLPTNWQVCVCSCVLFVFISKFIFRICLLFYTTHTHHCQFNISENSLRYTIKYKLQNVYDCIEWNKYLRTRIGIVNVRLANYKSHFCSCDSSVWCKNMRCLIECIKNRYESTVFDSTMNCLASTVTIFQFFCIWISNGSRLAREKHKCDWFFMICQSNEIIKIDNNRKHAPI